MLLYIFDLIGTAVFAITGALVGRDKRVDVYGVVMFGLVTAVGGGTLRDMLLGRTPVFWIRDPMYIYVAVGAAIFTFFTAKYGILSRRFLIVADAVGLALFTVIGAQIALERGTPPMIAVVMGIMTGTGGGITRDLLAREIPLVLRKEIYATASLGGALVYVIWAQAMPPGTLTTIASMILTTLLRLASLKWGGSLPLFLPDDPNMQQQ
ncbi:MAG: trimeric intracellular cation channel family protein [Chloroflexota bacterium]